VFKSLYTCTNVVTGTGVSAFLSPSSLPSQSVTIHVFFTRDIFSFSLPVGINKVVELCLVCKLPVLFLFLLVCWSVYSVSGDVMCLLLLWSVGVCIACLEM